MINQREVQFPAGPETISGRFVMRHDDIDSSPRLLLLHGAGKATKERALPLAVRLAQDYGIPSFGFDFSGHGASTGSMVTSSLKKRVEEARAAIEYAEMIEPISLCGFSMGAHVALELLKQKSVRGLLLFYPGVYTPDAFEIPFGDPEFHSTIRRDRSWSSAEGFETIKQFTGNLLIVIGEKDEVIPPEIPKWLMENATRAAKKRLIIVPQAPHGMLPVLLETPDLYDDVCSTIKEYVDGQA